MRQIAEIHDSSLKKGDLIVVTGCLEGYAATNTEQVYVAVGYFDKLGPRKYCLRSDSVTSAMVNLVGFESRLPFFSIDKIFSLEHDDFHVVPNTLPNSFFGKVSFGVDAHDDDDYPKLAGFFAVQSAGRVLYYQHDAYGIRPPFLDLVKHEHAIVRAEVLREDVAQAMLFAVGARRPPNLEQLLRPYNLGEYVISSVEGRQVTPPEQLVLVF